MNVQVMNVGQSHIGTRLANFVRGYILQVGIRRMCPWFTSHHTHRTFHILQYFKFLGVMAVSVSCHLAALAYVWHNNKEQHWRSSSIIVQISQTPALRALVSKIVGKHEVLIWRKYFSHDKLIPSATNLPIFKGGQGFCLSKRGNEHWPSGMVGEYASAVTTFTLKCFNR